MLVYAQAKFLAVVFYFSSTTYDRNNTYKITMTLKESISNDTMGKVRVLGTAAGV